MNIRPIRSAKDHARALKRIECLLEARPGTPDGDELDVLTTLVEAYEQQHFQIHSPDPVELIKNAMEFKGLAQSELAELLHSRSRASEILARKRPLTLHQIRIISTAWQLPADSLIGEYEVA